MAIKLTFLGQCGFIIQSDNLTIAIDPCLNDITSKNKSIRNYQSPILPEKLDVDYVFCTHDHIDHLAPETLTKIAASNSTVKFLIPLGCKKMLTDLSIAADRIITLSDGSRTIIENGKVVTHASSDSSFAGFSVKAFSTAHPVHQKDSNGFDRNLGYAITIDSKQIVHLGDTYYTEHLEKTLSRIGKIDVLITPINGMSIIKKLHGIIGNLSIKESVKLCTKLMPLNVIPSHFDMIKGNTADPVKFQNMMKIKNPEQKIFVPELCKDILIK